MIGETPERTSGLDAGARRGGSSTGPLRRELRRLRAALDRAETELDRLERQDSDGASERPRPERYYQVLVAVYERGVHGLSSQELASVAGHLGYDRRGLGGYYAGARAPLRMEDDRVALTTEGQRLVREYLERTTS